MGKATQKTRSAILGPLAFALGLSWLVLGCAPARVTLRQVQDYRMAISLAEQAGADTQDMRVRYRAMLVSYLERPGEDPYVEAARKSSEALEWDATANVYTAFRPEPYVPPLTFNEWRGR